MMNNLFSQFDPLMNSLNPFILTFSTCILLFSMPLKSNTTKIMKIKSLMNLMKENKSNLLENNHKSNITITSSIFLFVASINLMALTLYSWSSTSHMSFNSILIMTSWTPILLMILTKKKKPFIIHLIPPSTPNLLIPFMFLIEMISFAVRPITLTLRLTANMIAGHIMINLNSNMIMSSDTFNIMPLLPLLILTLMEMLVAILQAYIIMTLLSMFISEI